MEQNLILHRKDGTFYRLNSYDGSYGVTAAEQSKELMGVDVVTISILAAQPLDFAIGDYLEVFGERYTLNSLPEAAKENDRRFSYTLTLEGARYDLIKVQYLNVDDTGYSTGTDFSLMGNLNDFVSLIVRNANRIYGNFAWEIGNVTQNTDTKLLTFHNQTCLQALQELCDIYEQEFYIERTGPESYEINVALNNDEMQDTFRYGRAKGLYELSRRNIDNKNIITRLYAYGSTKNIPANYRGGSVRLKMPQTSIFSEALPYIQASTAIVDRFGIVEASTVFEDVFPERTGAVTSIITGGNNPHLSFGDTSMPFDLNAMQNGQHIYRLPDTEPRVNFKSGNLAGYEFAVTNYDSSTKIFTLAEYTDDHGNKMPSSVPAFQIQPGDEYVLLNISLPQSYVNNAESRLRTKALKYLSENSKPRIQYSLTLDRFYIKDRIKSSGVQNYFKEGNYLRIIDPDMKVNSSIQIKQFTRDLIDIYQYQVELGEKTRLKIIALNNQVNRIQLALDLNNIAVSTRNAPIGAGNITNNQTINVQNNLAVWQDVGF